MILLIFAAASLSFFDALNPLLAAALPARLMFATRLPIELCLRVPLFMRYSEDRQQLLPIAPLVLCARINGA